MSVKRKKHVMTEYEAQRRAYREASFRHVVTFEVDLSEDGKRCCFSTADDIRKAGNAVRGILLDRVIQMKRTKRYRKLMSDYAYCKTRMDRVGKDSEEYKDLMDRKASIGKQMSAMQKEFHVTWNDTRKEMERISRNMKGMSVFLLREAESVWQAFEKVLFSDGKRIHFKKRGDLSCIRAKQYNKAIVMKATDGKLNFTMSNVGSFGVKIPDSDLFLQEEASRIIRFLQNPDVIEKNAVEMYAESQIITDTFRPCYVSIKCETIRGKLRVYVQVTVEGKACPKVKQDSSPRHDFSKTGIVGNDIGTQSTAVCSASRLILENLAERDHKSTKQSEALERRLLRKLDRSRRAMNPDNYNPDGTVKLKSLRKPWVNSKTYIKTRDRYREIARKNALSRKYANQEIANRVRALGDTLVTEPKNAKRLQKKAKESKVKIREDGSKKFSKRKRFGKSVHDRSPGQYQAELKKKFGSDHYIEVPGNYRASQYDHTADAYVKKELSERMFKLSDGTKVQRDLYSAFLLAHPDPEGKAPDGKWCKMNFDSFKKQMDQLIADIRKSGYKVCNSGI